MTKLEQATEIINNVLNNDYTISFKSPANVWYVYKEDGMIAVDADWYYNGYRVIADDCGANDAIYLVCDILNNNLSNC
mgnify:CR=1 FL=1